MDCTTISTSRPGGRPKCFRSSHSSSGRRRSNSPKKGQIAGRLEPNSRFVQFDSSFIRTLQLWIHLAPHKSKHVWRTTWLVHLGSSNSSKMKSENPLLKQTAWRFQSSMPESLCPRCLLVPVSRISIKPKESRNHKAVVTAMSGLQLVRNPSWLHHNQTRRTTFLVASPGNFKSPSDVWLQGYNSKNHWHIAVAFTIQIFFRSLQLKWMTLTKGSSYLSPGAEWHSIFKQQLLTVMLDSRKLLGGLAEAPKMSNTLTTLLKYRSWCLHRSQHEVYLVHWQWCSYSLPRFPVLFDPSCQLPKLERTCGKPLLCS